MGILLYGPAAIAALEELAPHELNEWAQKTGGVERPEPGPDVTGVEIDDTAGPIVYCQGNGEGACDSRVRFDWRVERQLCDACGGPPIAHAPNCPASYRVDRTCSCGAR